MSLLKFFALNAFLLSSTFVLNSNALGQDVSWSEILKDYESPDKTKENEALFREENRYVNAVVKKSSKYSEIHSYFLNRYSKPNEVKNIVLSTGESIVLRELGYGKPRLIESSVSGVLLSSFDSKKNETVVFTDISISPSEKYLLVSVVEKGSINAATLYIYSLQQKRLLKTYQADSSSGDLRIRWIGANIFYYYDLQNQRLKVYLESPNLNGVSENDFYYGEYPKNVLCRNNSTFVLNAANKYVLLDSLGCSEWNTFKYFKSYVRFISEDEYNIISVSNYSRDIALGPVLGDSYPVTQGVFDSSITSKEGHVLLSSTWGPDQKITILDSSFAIIDEYLVPHFLKVDQFKYDPWNSMLNLTVSSSVKNHMDVYIDLSTKKLIGTTLEELRKNSLNKNGIQYDSDVIYVKSSDGVDIPTRVVAKETIDFSKNPFVFIEVYGGYGSPSHLLPENESKIRDIFISKGGVYVAPGTRGGNEYGNAWHEAGRRKNKINSINDLIDVANDLISRGVSPEHIITNGTSHGGLVVASAALLSPQSFGLVIPISPVLDMLGKQRLNPLFVRTSMKEYGDVNDTEIANLMKAYSPLELPVSERSPEMLIICGLNDTRVSALHSLKFMRKVRKQLPSSSPIHAYFVKNTGHWLMSMDQDLIGVQANTVMWTYIAEYMQRRP